MQRNIRKQAYCFLRVVHCFHQKETIRWHIQMHIIAILMNCFSCLIGLSLEVGKQFFKLIQLYIHLYTQLLV